MSDRLGGILASVMAWLGLTVARQRGRTHADRAPTRPPRTAAGAGHSRRPGRWRRRRVLDEVRVPSRAGNAEPVPDLIRDGPARTHGIHADMLAERLGFGGVRHRAAEAGPVPESRGGSAVAAAARRDY